MTRSRHLRHLSESLDREAPCAAELRGDPRATRTFLLRALLAPALVLASCSTPSLPEGTGKGLLSADAEPPPGAETFQRPTWKKGDRFVYRRGTTIRLAFRVEGEDEGGYRLVEEETGMINLYTRDLGESAQEKEGVPEARRVLDPTDSLFSWPLWEGKRWSCHFLSKAPGRPVLPLAVFYHCDETETVTVPAGTFRALRIWRRSRVAAEGAYVERVALFWYAPDVGFFVRRLDDGLLTDLEEFHRQ